MSDTKRKNRVALITGASRGIGRAVAEGLYQDGWSVALLARGEDKLREVEHHLLAQGENNARVLSLPLDVTDEGAVTMTVARVEEELGPIELLFNNAGVYQGGTCELSKEQFERLFEVNVTGAWNLVRAVIPLLKQRGEGYIINLASIAGTVGFPGVGGYCASKFALRGLNESLFNELVPEGIKVTAISPSWVDTEMASHASFTGDKMIRPEDILNTIRYLLSLSGPACVKEMVVQCKEDLV